MTKAPPNTDKKGRAAAWGTRAIPLDVTIKNVRGALGALERGQLGPAALLADAMTRDDRIGGALDTRIKGMMGLPRAVMVSAGDGRRRSALSREVEARLNAGEFGSRAALRRWQRYGLMLGVCFAQILWDTESVGGRWIPSLDVWHPSHFSYDMARGVWRVQTRGGMQDITPDSEQWAGFMLDDAAPWLEGLVRRLAIPYLVKQFAVRDWASYSEVHGQPIRKAKIPAQAAQDQKDRFLSGIADLGSEATIEIPELGNGLGSFDLELVEAASRSWEGFKELINKCDASISITILGQNLTTEVKGGSLAAAKVHEKVKTDIIKDDATLFSEAFRDGILRPFTIYNFGDVALTPELVIDTEPPSDLGEAALTLEHVSNAVKTFADAGYSLDLKELAAKYGIKLEQADPAPAPADPPAPEPAPAKGKGNTPPSDGVKAAKTAPYVIRLASGYSVSQSSGFIAGQLYADAVTDAHAAAAAEAMADELEAISRVIASAQSYEDMRAALIEYLGAAAPPEQLAALMQKALILAKLAGRLAVKEDL